MVRRPHWSYSQLNQFLRCPLQFFFERVVKLPKPFLPSNLVLGSAVHEALATFHRNIQVGEPPTKEKLKEEFLAGWSRRQGEVPIRFGKNETAIRLIDQGVAVLEACASEPPPERIVAVEQELIVPLYNSQGEFLEKPLVAVLDLLCESDDHLTAVEFKTSQRKFGAAEVDRSLQSVAYRHALQEKYARPAKVRYTVLVKTKTPSVQHLDATGSGDDFGRLGDLVQTVERAIEADAFYPIESAMNCSGCPFRKPCREWRGSDVHNVQERQPAGRAEVTRC